jgi:hypothetical protein
MRFLVVIERLPAGAAARRPFDPANDVELAFFAVFDARLELREHYCYACYSFLSVVKRLGLYYRQYMPLYLSALAGDSCRKMACFRVELRKSG